MNFAGLFALDGNVRSLESYKNRAIYKYYKKNDDLLAPAEIPQHLLYLEKGQVARLAYNQNGAEKVMRIVGAGGLIGETLFFRKEPNASRFIALQDCHCYLFDEKTIYALMQQDERFLREIVLWLSNRMSSLSEQVIDTLTKSPEKRIFSFLLEYAKHFGTKDTLGNYSYQGKLSHYAIANYLGLNRVSVTKAIKTLQDENFLKKDTLQFIINEDGLK